MSTAAGTAAALLLPEGSTSGSVSGLGGEQEGGSDSGAASSDGTTDTAGPTPFQDVSIAELQSSLIAQGAAIRVPGPKPTPAPAGDVLIAPCVAHTRDGYTTTMAANQTW
jgi:hypothetical protein